MQSYARIILLVIILGVLTIGLIIWWGTPQILSFSPSKDEPNVSTMVNLTITFSRPMQEETVIERLTIKPYNPGSFSWEGNTLVFAPDQPWSTNTTVQVQLDAGSRASSILSMPIRKSISWVFRIGKPRLAYLYPASEPADIYLLDSLTGESMAITRVPEGVQDFVVNSKGNLIYFSTQDEQIGSSIFRLELDRVNTEESTTENGSEQKTKLPVKILECPNASCRALAISPDEEYMAYERTPYPETEVATFPQVWIYQLIDAENDELPASEFQPFLAGEITHQTIMPLWSSDGILAFYDVDSKAFIFSDPRKGELSRFVNQTGQPGAWHPNGRDFAAPEIIFLVTNSSGSDTQQEPPPESHLLLINWQSGVFQDLTPSEDVEDAVPSFSPNGDYLAFARKFLDTTHWTLGRQIWLMQIETNDSRPLTNNPLFNHYDFAWSPDSDQLAFVMFDQSSMIDPPEIWVIDISTGQSTQLVQGGYAPQWIP